MARPPKNRVDDQAADDAADAEERRGPEKEAAKSNAPPGSFKAWFDEHWHGWIKSVALIVALVVAYVLYDRHLVPEGSAGLVLIALIIGGSIYSAVEPVWEGLGDRRQRLALGGFLAVWAIGAGVPPLLTAFPRKALGEPVAVGYCGRYADPEKRECVDPKLTATATLPEGSTGPYEVLVSGDLRGSGEVEASYHLALATEGGVSEEVEGSLARVYVNQRTSRRSAGGAVVRQEHNEKVHRVSLKGHKITVTTEGVDEDLENGLIVAFRPAGPPPLLFVILTALCLLAGMVLDHRFYSPKLKTHFATWIGLTLVFAAYYPTEATPHNLVRPAVAALVASSLGALGGWLLSRIAMSFKKLPRKTAAKSA